MGRRRFILELVDGKLELEPIQEPEKVRGKYNGLTKKSIEEVEEDQEKYLLRGR